MRKKILEMILLFSVLPFYVYADDLTCASDENSVCEWSYDEQTHTLNIWGTGTMKDYGPDGAVGNDKLIYQAQRPWNDIALDIENVVISGLTSVGNRAFQGMKNLKNVTLPEGLTMIGRSSFAMSLGKSVNNQIEKLVIPSSIETILGDAFGSMMTGQIYCVKQKEDICKAAVQASNLSDNQLQIYEETSGGYFVNGKFYTILNDVGTENYLKKRIYTIEEATKLSKETGNTIKLRYK